MYTKKVSQKLTDNTPGLVKQLTKRKIEFTDDFNMETGVAISNSSVPVIEIEEDFKAALDEINTIMSKGDGHLTKEETLRLRLLSLAVRNYDRSTYSIERPKTLGAILELQKLQRGWKQKQLAQTLGISETKLSLIISGGQKPDAQVLKAIHTELGIDGNFILEVI